MEEMAAEAVRVMPGLVAMGVEKWVAAAVERTAQAEKGEPRGKRQVERGAVRGRLTEGHVVKHVERAVKGLAFQRPPGRVTSTNVKGRQK